MGGGGAIYESTQDTRYRQYRAHSDFDMATMLSKQKHSAMVSDARALYMTFPLVHGAITQKAEYVSSSGWVPQFDGKDNEWGRKAEQILIAANRIADVRGPLFSFSKNFEIGSALWDVDGEWYIILAESKEGFPVFQFLEAHRVGTRLFGTRTSKKAKVSGDRVVDGGTFDGARILNGIIYNGQGREIAYRVLGSSPEMDRDIPATDMYRAANPRWFSEGRGIPNLAYAVLDLWDIKETRYFERIAQKMNSALALTEDNEGGFADANPLGGQSNVGIDESKPSIQVESFEGGMIRYYKANSGAGIKTHTSDRPSDQWLNFDKQIIQSAMYGMGWRIEMLDLSTLRGAPVRGFQDNINKTIHARFNALAPIAKRCALYQVAKLIKRGDLPEHPEWDKWTFTPPADFTVDASKQSQTDRENIRGGLDTHVDAIRRRGEDPENQLRKQARFIQLRNQIAAEHKIEPKELGRLDKPGDDTDGGQDPDQSKDPKTKP